MKLPRAIVLLALIAASVPGVADQKVETELEFKGKIDVPPPPPSGKCSASLSLDYYQKGTHAHVKSTVENYQCGASSGSYVLRIRYRTDSGEMNTAEFAETWRRDDDDAVVIEKDYYVGEDLEIRRISSTRLRCQCDEPATSPSPVDGAVRNDVQ